MAMNRSSNLPTSSSGAKQTSAPISAGASSIGMNSGAKKLESDLNKPTQPSGTRPYSGGLKGGQYSTTSGRGMSHTNEDKRKSHPVSHIDNPAPAQQSLDMADASQIPPASSGFRASGLSGVHELEASSGGSDMISGDASSDSMRDPDVPMVPPGLSRQQEQQSLPRSEEYMERDQRKRGEVGRIAGDDLSKRYRGETSLDESGELNKSSCAIKSGSEDRRVTDPPTDAASGKIHEQSMMRDVGVPHLASAGNPKNLTGKAMGGRPESGLSGRNQTKDHQDEAMKAGVAGQDEFRDKHRDKLAGREGQAELSSEEGESIQSKSQAAPSDQSKSWQSKETSSPSNEMSRSATTASRSMQSRDFRQDSSA